MCGIAGFVMLGKKRYPDQVDFFAECLLDAIDHRGGDACGILAVTDEGKYHLQKAACDAKDFGLERKEIPADTQMCILHTRFATQGHQGFNENNHPVYSDGIYVTHNGHIMNDYSLFNATGIERSARVDSEIIPAMIGRYGWDDSGLKASLEQLDGGFAIAAVSVDRPNELILARGANSPLWVLKTKHMLVWASEFTAIRRAWERTFGGTPAFDKFQEIAEGTILRKLETGNIVTSRFQVPDWWTQYTKYAKPLTPTVYGKTGWSDMDDEAWGNEAYWDDANNEWEETSKGIWRKKRKDGSTPAPGSAKFLEALADKVLAEHGVSPEDEVPFGETPLLQCHSCGDWDEPDEMILEERYAYCLMCVEGLEALTGARITQLAS